MVVSSLTSSKYWDIGENHLNWTHLRHNSRLSQKQNGSWLRRTLGFWTDAEWSISSQFIWKVMPSKHLTERNTLRDNALHTHTQYKQTVTMARRLALGVMFNVICSAPVWRNNRLYD